MTRVTVFSRPGCHLCEDAIAVVERVRAALDFELEIIDIESDDTLLARYLERIPVVAVDGQERFEFFVAETDLARCIANLSRPAPGPVT